MNSHTSFYADLTIDKHNRVWCIYQVCNPIDTSHHLIVAHKDTIGWIKDTIISTNGSKFQNQSRASFWVSIITDSAGSPHIAFQFSANGYYAYLSDTIWYKEVVCFTYAYCCAIDVDAQGRPHISHFFPADNLWYAKRIDGIWYREEVDRTNYASWWTTSIRINPTNDLPAIAYRDPNTYQMKYAWYDSVVWNIDMLAVIGDIGTQKALDFDSLGRPWIIYGDIDFPVGVVAHKDSTGIWRKYPLPPLTPPLTYVGPGGLRVGRDGTIHTTRIAVSSDYTIREIHYIYGRPEGIEEAKFESYGVAFSLEIWPNIVSHKAQLQYTIPVKQSICLKLYDILGRKIATIAEGSVEPGVYTYNLDASSLNSGVYFLILEGEKETKSEKLLIVR